MEAYRKLGLSVNYGYYLTLFLMFIIGIIFLTFAPTNKNNLFVLVGIPIMLLHFYFTPIFLGYIHILGIKRKYGYKGKDYILNEFRNLKYGDTPNINFDNI